MGLSPLAQLFKVAHSSPPLTVLEVTTIYLFVGHSHVYLSFQPDLFTEFHTQNLTVLRTFQKRGRLRNATCPKGSSLHPLHACFSPQPPNLEMALPFASLGTSSSQVHPSSLTNASPNSLPFPPKPLPDQTSAYICPCSICSIH